MERQKLSVISTNSNVCQNNNNKRMNEAAKFEYNSKSNLNSMTYFPPYMQMIPQ